MAYLVASRANEFYSLREEIRKRCYSLCRLVFDRAGKDDQRMYSSIVVAGHSLGSVIAYDTVNKILAEESEVPSATSSSSRFRGFVTLGSPLDKAAFLFGYDAPESSNLRTQLVSCTQPLISGPELRARVPWINFWSHLDPVSATIDYYDLDPASAGSVVNVHDDESSVPLFAHVTYWRHKKLRSMLQAMCQPSKFDASQLRELGLQFARR